ncbi:MAG: HAMP domain-containing sensor histidine kinase [Eubacteriales bacterium]|nr:HAMP domain-containing sensor histidine kinase [Eubacteriales bacterium]
MEIKKKKQTLFRLFIRQIIILAAAFFLEVSVLLVLFNTGVSSGLIMRADYTQNYIRDNQKEISESDPFDPSLLPFTCKYGIFDEEGKLQDGTLRGKDLETAEKLAVNRDDSQWGFTVIPREKGICIVHYDILAQFSSPLLYRFLPNPEILLLILFVVLMILIVIINALSFGKKLRKELAPLADEIQQVKGKELELDCRSSDIKEFNDILLALNDMKQELSRSLKAQWETEQRRKDNISALAHDIKAPLTIIKGNAELMKEETDLEELYMQADAVDANADRIEEYIKLLIEETKTDTETTESRDKSFSIGEFMENTEMECRNLCRVHHIPVTVERHSQKGVVCADSEQIRRALMNLILNGIEHTKESEGLKVSLDYREGIFRAELEDFGEGFTREALKHCKEQFYTENAERSGSHYGMGMYFADSVAGKYGGKLEYYNKNGGDGAVVVFSVRLG